MKDVYIDMKIEDNVFILVTNKIHKVKIEEMYIKITKKDTEISFQVSSSVVGSHMISYKDAFKTKQGLINSL